LTLAAEFLRSVLGLLLAALLVWAPGAFFRRLARRRWDVFEEFLAGVLLWSASGLLLAHLERFSLFGAAALVAGAVLVFGFALRRFGAQDESARRPALAWPFGLLACVAAFTYLPPFETFIAASDSTMYLSAGVYLARHGSLAVPDRIGAELDPFQRQRNFPSVGLLGTGPFIRLAGGLVKRSRDDPEAAPAFFPLAPVWVALFTSLGDLRAGPLVAPFFQALAVWAVALFAAEAGGGAAGVGTWLLLVTNFAFWWYGRFLLSEPLAAFLLWGGLVELARARSRGREALVLAGFALAASGFARTEVVVLEAAAGVLIAFWGAPRLAAIGRSLPGIAAWLGVSGWVALQVAANPSHHQAYFATDLAFARLRLSLLWGAGLPEMVAAAALALLVLSGLLALRKGARVARYWLRGAAVFAVGGALGLYALLGGDFSPGRGMRWIAAYLGFPVLALSALGALQCLRGRLRLPPFGVIVWALAAMVFIVNPHVALNHPWAIRRFLVQVIPGLLVLAGLGAAVLVGPGTATKKRTAGALGLVLGAALFAGRPILSLRDKPFYRDTLAAVERLSDSLEPGANVVVESLLADWELQIPLWLVYGHETIMAHAPGPYWQAIAYTLTKPEQSRPLYWLTFGPRGYVTPPRVFGLSFQLVTEVPLAVGLPAQATDGPPANAFLMRTNLRLYKITRWKLPAKGPGSLR